MINDIEEIKKEAEALAEKKSWIRKGFSELLEKMNKEVQIVVGDFRVYGKLYDVPAECDLQVDISYQLVFDGGNDAEFFLQKHIDKYEARYETVGVQEIDTSTLRMCVIGLPCALDEILAKLRALNTKYQDTITLLSEMIARLK